LNGGFERVIHDLQALAQISFFCSDRVTAMRELIGRVRAEATGISPWPDREMANVGQFERLCTQWEKEIRYHFASS